MELGAPKAHNCLQENALADDETRTRFAESPFEAFVILVVATIKELFGNLEEVRVSTRSYLMVPFFDGAIDA